MKQFFYLTLFIISFSLPSEAQSLRGLDKSPMDAAYFPDNFAHDRKPGQKAIVKVIYSRPQMNGREVFGKLVPFGKVWRTGANEATEIKLYHDVELGGKNVRAGTYSLFTIPNEKEWTIILSSDLDYWGAFSYKQANDVLRVTVPATTTGTAVENFTIQFESKGENKGSMKLAWDKTVVDVPFKY